VSIVGLGFSDLHWRVLSYIVDRDANKPSEDAVAAEAVSLGLHMPDTRADENASATCCPRGLVGCAPMGSRFPESVWTSHTGAVLPAGAATRFRRDVLRLSA
jgi:hypothetical protein